MKIRRTTVLTVLLMSGVLLLSACRAEEQNRVTNYQPGVYKGKPDTPLTVKQVRNLLKRTFRQSDLVVTYGGGAKRRGKDVRPPSSADTRKMERELMLRAKKQRGS